MYNTTRKLEAKTNIKPDYLQLLSIITITTTTTILNHLLVPRKFKTPVLTSR